MSDRNGKGPRTRSPKPSVRRGGLKKGPCKPIKKTSKK